MKHKNNLFSKLAALFWKIYYKIKKDILFSVMESLILEKLIRFWATRNNLEFFHF